MELPVEIYSVAGVRNIDRVAISEAGIAGYTLMTRAGEQAAALARSRYPKSRHWLIVCGGGNNAGDGYVVARLAAQAGITVTVIAMVDPERLAGDAATAYRDFETAGGSVLPFDGALALEADLLVDALLGSGLERDVEGRFAAVVSAMNQHGAPIRALDIPSGLNGDTGQTMGTAVSAESTITFVGLKTGLFLDDGPDRAGHVEFAGLGIPDECRAGESALYRRIRQQDAAGTLPRRQRASHKGSFGHVLVIGGGEGMPGAVRLCGIAALRAGAGLVSVATHPSHSSMIPVGAPELMCHAVSSPGDLESLMERASVIALGPGLGTTSWSDALFDAVAGADVPLVVDADALNLLARRDIKRDNWILTPHPGEAARLLSASVAEVQADRRHSVQALAEQYGGTVILKGAGSLVSSGDGTPWLCDRGNPGMSSAGMGDVLTGLIAGLCAQGLTSEQAATTGVFVHAVAGDRAAQDGERGLIATDVLAEIRCCVNP